MCNAYSVTSAQTAIIEWTRAMRDITGNLPAMPGVFPDYLAPIVRNAPDGARELMMARWGMPGPPQFGGAPITNIRNTKSPHWRAWLKPENRCVVPFNSFCEYADTKRRKTPTWFALNNDRPLAFFAGIWTSWHDKRGTKANPVEGEHQLFGFLTTDANEEVGAIHPKAMPVIFTPARSSRRMAHSASRGCPADAKAVGGWSAQDRRARREGRQPRRLKGNESLSKALTKTMAGSDPVCPRSRNLESRPFPVELSNLKLGGDLTFHAGYVVVERDGAAQVVADHCCEQPAAEPRSSRDFNRRPTGLFPIQMQHIFLDAPSDTYAAGWTRECAILGGVGRKFVQCQRQGKRVLRGNIDGSPTDLHLCRCKGIERTRDNVG